MTDTIGAPLAEANVRASWKLMPHSAWPAVMSASGVDRAIRQDLEVDAGRVVPAVRPGDEEPVWFVFGVQSRARRTVPSGPVEADGTGDAAADALWGGTAGDGNDVEGDAVPPALQPALTTMAAHVRREDAMETIDP